MKTLDFTARFTIPRLEFIKAWREIVGKRPVDLHASWHELPDGSEQSFMAFTQRTSLNAWDIMAKFCERGLMIDLRSYDHATGSFVE